MRGGMFGLSAFVLIGACSNAPSDDAFNSINVDEVLTTENVVQSDAQNDVMAVDAPPLKPARPSHLYNFREGDLYGYIAAVSEEDSKRGKVAGDVVLYRYKGFWDSADHLERVDASGRTVGYDECSRPCVAIKSKYYGRVERLAFNSASVVGGAFQDAVNGKLQVPSAKPEPKTTDPYEGYNSVQDYREAVADENASEEPSANEQ